MISVYDFKRNFNTRGGDIMNAISKYSVFFASAVLAFGSLMVFAVPAVQAADNTALLTPRGLGLEYGEQTGLGSSDVRDTVARIIRVAMGLLGIVAVVIILIGGFKWMTAGGNDEAVGEAKKWIFAGVIGLAIILSAYALASFVINNLLAATTNTTL